MHHFLWDVPPTNRVRGRGRVGVTGSVVEFRVVVTTYVFTIAEAKKKKERGE